MHPTHETKIVETLVRIADALEKQSVLIEEQTAMAKENHAMTMAVLREQLAGAESNRVLTEEAIATQQRIWRTSSVLRRHRESRPRSSRSSPIETMTAATVRPLSSPGTRARRRPTAARARSGFALDVDFRCNFGCRG